MSDEDDGSILLWLALGAAVIYFLSRKFSPPATAAPSLLPAPSSSSSVTAAPATPDLTAAATAASAPPIDYGTDSGIENTENW